METTTIDIEVLYEHMGVEEGVHSQIYVDAVGVPTVGVGIALFTKSDGEYKVKGNLFEDDNGYKAIFTDSTGVTFPDESAREKFIVALGKVVEVLNANISSSNSNKKSKVIAKIKEINDTTETKKIFGTITDKMINNRSNIYCSAITIDGNEEQKAVLQNVQLHYEQQVVNQIALHTSKDVGGAEEIYKSLSDEERTALYSAAYTATTVIGKNLSNALVQYKDSTDEDKKILGKLRAWLEIRCYSNPDDIHANRRYRESDLFGLFKNPNDINEKEVKNFFTFLQTIPYPDKKPDTKVINKIMDYEETYSPTNQDASEFISVKVKDTLLNAKTHYEADAITSEYLINNVREALSYVENSENNSLYNEVINGNSELKDFICSVLVDASIDSITISSVDDAYVLLDVIGNFFNISYPKNDLQTNIAKVDALIEKILVTNGVTSDEAKKRINLETLMNFQDKLLTLSVKQNFI